MVADAQLESGPENAARQVVGLQWSGPVSHCRKSGQSVACDLECPRLAILQGRRWLVFERHAPIHDGCLNMYLSVSAD